MTKTKFELGHIGVELIVDPASGPTFALYAPESPTPEKVVFSGPVFAGMADELLALSDYVRMIEPRR